MRKRKQSDSEVSREVQREAGDKATDRSTYVMDKELAVYRDLVTPPDSFSEGFSWSTVAGALFCGLVMFPGGIYLGLLSGLGMTGAATWVTVIVFSEIMRRALKSMNKQEMVILLSAAGVMIGGNAMIPGGPFGQLIWRQYLVTSDAVREAGLFGMFPTWYAPSPDATALAERTFWDSAWAQPVMLILFTTIIGFVNHFTLGYGIFRLTSDVERLPFPMAPVQAQGVTALAEGERGERTWRWTAFSTGTVLGLSYGFIQVGVPALTSAFLDRPITIVPLPWFDLTTVTQRIMPATATGIIFDMGLLLLGFVLPLWAVIGAAFSVMLTFVLNPVLYHFGVLHTWQAGMDTINTQVANEVDFYFSANIGIALGIAACSIFQTARQVAVLLRDQSKRRAADRQAVSMWAPPKGRGDWPLSLCFLGYIVSAAALVTVCKILVPSFSVAFLVLFAFLYTPLASYLNARINGIAGQHVDIPFVREGFILLSSAKGVDPWLAPFPLDNVGGAAQGFRALELTGTKFTSQIKVWLLTTPLIFLLSFVFWSFLWRDGPIPSALFPFAQRMWDLSARRAMIMWSSTTSEAGAVTLFERAFHPGFIGVGFTFSTATFILLSILRWPTMLVYGMARGMGEGLPHGLVLQLTGALLARFYFHRRFGKKRFLQMAPILLAGYFVGTGLVGMAAVAVRLVVSAISQEPF